MANASGGSSTESWLRRLGWLFSGLAILFLAADSAMKLLALPVVVEAGAALGFVGDDMARRLGVVLGICVALYAAPRTAILGAVLLTAYLGGAVAAHLRMNSPLVSHVLFGVYVGAFVWAGVFLREPRLRQLFPVRRSEQSA